MKSKIGCGPSRTSASTWACRFKRSTPGAVPGLVLRDAEWEATSLQAAGRARLGGLVADGGRGMKPRGLGEHGGISITREDGGYVAYVRYRDYSGRGRHI